jgi:exopolyphosphatase / guanosine-5'-triphosphate,3'-diphosphate pyrophosphatase
VENRRRLPGVDPARADILLAGAVILEQVMADLGIDRLVVSDYALREGVLLDGHAREHGAALHHLQDLRRRSVMHLVEMMDDDPGHSQRVAELALSGFTDHEIELIALVARYHRKSAPKAKHTEFAALRPGDQALVRALAGLSRMAIALDRTHAGAVRSVEVREHDGGLVVDVVARPDADISLEIFTATERKSLLEEVFGRPLHVVANHPELSTP